MKFEALVNEVLGQGNPVLGLNLPSREQQQQKTNLFQQQQQKSVQDVKGLGSGALETAKFLDPSGILSWNDAYKAYQEYTKTPNPVNGLVLGIALGSVIPAAKYYVSPAKAALKAGKTQEAANLLKNVLPKIKQILTNTPEPLRARGMEIDAVKRALEVNQYEIGRTVQELKNLERLKQGKSIREPDAIIEFFKNPENKEFVKQLKKEAGLMALIMTAPPLAAIPVANFIQKKFPNLGSDIQKKVAEYIITNPQVLEQN